MELVAAVGVFAAGYLVNMFFITVLYHRGLTHSALELSPALMRIVGRWGVWCTGLEPKAWACMHRLHHQFSDAAGDPHSPRTTGIWGVWLAQYDSYKRVLAGLNRNDAAFTRVVADLSFDISALNRARDLSWLPYLAHAAIGVALGALCASWLIGASYFLGMLSHPVQGWLVNALAHSFGARRFATSDDSRNNFWIALLVFGEGLQNNHHAFPKRANFSFARREPDFGYQLCRLAQRLGWLRIKH